MRVGSSPTAPTMANTEYNNRAFIHLRSMLLHQPKPSDLKTNSLVDTAVALWQQDNPNYTIQDLQIECPTIYNMNITFKVVPKKYFIDVTISKTYDEGFIL